METLNQDLGIVGSNFLKNSNLNGHYNRWKNMNDVFFSKKINIIISVIELSRMKRMCVLFRMTQKLGSYLFYIFLQIDLSECVFDVFHWFMIKYDIIFTFDQKHVWVELLIQITYARSNCIKLKVLTRRRNRWGHIFEFLILNGQKIQISTVKNLKIWISTVKN